MVDVVLINFRPDGSRRSLSLSKAISIIGRRPDSDLRIPLANVSRQHCRIVKDDQAARVEDLGSSNGTMLNYERVSLAVLQPGDVLSIGGLDFVIQINGSPLDSELTPPSPSTHGSRKARNAAPAPSFDTTATNSNEDIDAILASPDPEDSAFSDVMIDLEERQKAD